ncbi:MAG: DUF3520 domain-containing protein [Pirellulales bacterium]|nr:DUF3520 domain-containing protein [Pirellulales bacterium]
MSPLDPNVEAWLDDRLRDVPVPPGLASRLRAIPLEQDGDLDAAVRDVAVPLDLRARLSRIARRPRRGRRLVSSIVAASLVVGVALGYLGAVAGLMRSSYARRDDRPAARVEPPRRVRPALVTSKDMISAPLAEETAPPDVFRDVLAPREGLWVDDPSPSDLGVFPLDQDHAEVDPLLDLSLYRGGVLGSPAKVEQLPELKEAPALARRGVEFPLVPGFDVAWLEITGVHPFVSPAAHPALRASVVPLSVGTTSYERAWRLVEANKPLPPAEIRTEEFLAAIDYAFARPEHEAMELHLLAGPSLTDPRLRLLQVGVQARDAASGGEVSTNSSQPVARNVRLEVSFEPKVVGLYRLLGHEGTSMAGLRAAKLDTDFAAGQSATAVFEIATIPEAQGEAALVRLSWIDAATGEARELVRTIQSGDLHAAKTLPEAPASVQAAAVAALGAEVLRGSPFVRIRPVPITLAHVLQVTRFLDPALVQNPSFVRYVSLLEKAQRANPARRSRQR